MDAFPEKSRKIASICFFLLNLISLLILFVAITSGASELDDQTFVILDRSFTISSVAVGAIGSLSPFALKNLINSVTRPGSLAVLQADVLSVKLDQSVLHVLQAAHQLLVSEGKDSNATLHRMATDTNLKAIYTSARPAWTVPKKPEALFTLSLIQVDTEEQFDQEVPYA